MQTLTNVQGGHEDWVKIAFSLFFKREHEDVCKYWSCLLLRRDKEFDKILQMSCSLLDLIFTEPFSVKEIFTHVNTEKYNISSPWSVATHGNFLFPV